jgi:predicted AAA+ superfamily ATPase
MALPGKVSILYGPRQVGKTTLMKDMVQTMNWNSRFLSADEISVREGLSTQSLAELEQFTSGVDTLIIDEAQRIPDIGINLKILVDNFPNVRFIVTGSASLELANKIREPLTGRTMTFNLFPICFSEICQAYGDFDARRKLEELLIWGEYPEVITTDDQHVKGKLLDEIVGFYLYRDLLEIEGIRRSEKIVDLLRMIAFQIGQEVSLAELASGLNIHRDTVEKYLDLLEKSFVIYRVGGYAHNSRKGITKNARYYFFDNGVRNSLIRNLNSISLRNDIGQLWENFLMIERWKRNEYIDRRVNRYFWRTYDQKEIDYIEETGGVISGYEFKWTGKIKNSTVQVFTEANPGSTVSVVDRQNFESFIR